MQHQMEEDNIFEKVASDFYHSEHYLCHQMEEEDVQNSDQGYYPCLSRLCHSNTVFAMQSKFFYCLNVIVWSIFFYFFVFFYTKHEEEGVQWPVIFSMLILTSIISSIVFVSVSFCYSSKCDTMNIVPNGKRKGL